MKLNQREQTILKALQDGDRAIYMPYQGRFNPNAYYTVGNVGKCTREMKKFISLGLVDEKPRGFSNVDLTLSELGKNFQCDAVQHYDVWCVENSYIINVRKFFGSLNKTTFTSAGGSQSKENHTRKYFLNRDDAFQYAIKQQEKNIKIDQSKLGRSMKTWEELQERSKIPNADYC